MIHVVPVSGGKDSTSLAIWLAENEPRDYIYVCTPTGNELPGWYEHMRGLSVRLGHQIQPIIGGTLDLRAEFEKGRVPPRTARQRDLFRGEMMCRVCRL